MFHFCGIFRVKPMNVTFHPSVSYRRYGDFAVLLDRHQIARLNASAGVLLDVIDEGRSLESETEKAFADSLEKAGFLSSSCADFSESSSQNAAREESGVYDDLNRWAARTLTPLHLHLELTWRCALSCRHCYLDGIERRPEDELTLEEIERFLTEARDLGVLFLTLSGGEPFLRNDFEDIVAIARRMRFSVSVLTSGWKTEMDQLERLTALGLDGLQVSLYGADAELHDGFTRREGSFAKAWETLTTGRELGLSVRAAVSVTRWNVHALEDIDRKLRDAEIPWNPVVNLFPRRVTGQLPDGLQLDGEAFREVLKRLPERKRFRMADLQPGDPPCNAGRSMVAIDPHGHVSPCPTWPQVVGNIREKPFSEIWKQAPELQAIRALTLADLEDCPNCPHRATCNRCPGFAQWMGTTEKGHSPLDCLQAKEYGNYK